MTELMMNPLGFKTITVKDVYDAIKKNGFKYIRGRWFSSTDGKITGGCVLGQAALNLNVQATDDINNSLIAQLDKLGTVGEGNKWENTIFCPSNYGLGNAIVAWNDAKDYYEQGSAKSWESIDRMVAEGALDYKLETYEEVVAMCYDLLSPYFEKELYVRNYDYRV